MTTLRHAARLLAAASAFAAFAAPASAQQIDRIVAFGDSYADNGNFFEILGANPSSSVIYTSGRFSGGTNYIDSLSQILGVPVDNFAIGGAMAQTFPGGAQNVNCGTYAITCDKGFTYQVTKFLAGGNTTGPGNATYPAVSGAFGPNDLLTVTIGGNDSRYYQQTGGTVAGASASAALSVTAASTQLDKLIAAGAPTLSFLAYNTALAPELAYYPDPAGAAAVRNAFSSAYNTGIQKTLSGYAANGVMVHYLDLTLVAQDIAKNPTAYGITKGTAATNFACPPSAVSTECVANSDGYLFYIDQLHLTSTGFKIVAKYVAAQLEAPLMIGGPSTITLDNARQFGKVLTQRMDASAPRDGDMPEGLRFNIAGDGHTGRYDMNNSSEALRSSGVGVTASLDYGFGSGIAGIAIRGSRQHGHYYGDIGGSKGRSLELGGYMAYGFGPAFIQGYAGLGLDKVKESRTGVVLGIDASPKGHHALAGIKGGYLVPMMGMRVGPVAGLDWAHGYVKSYSEEGDPALNLNVGSVKAKSLRGDVGIEARGDIDLNGTAFRPFASVSLEKQLGGNDRTVFFREQAAPTIVNHWDVMGESKSVYGRLKGGIAAGVSSNVRIDASIEGTVGRDGGNEGSGNLAARIAF